MSQIITGRVAKHDYCCYCCGGEIEQGSKYTDFVEKTLEYGKRKFYHKRFHQDCFVKKSSTFDRIVEFLKTGPFPVQNTKNVKCWVIGVATEPETGDNLVVLRGWNSNVFNCMKEDQLNLLLDYNGNPL